MTDAIRMGSCEVHREGSHIEVRSPNRGLRQPPETSLTVDLSEDRVEIRGRKDREPCNWNIQLSPEGAQVSQPRSAGLRRGSFPSGPIPLHGECGVTLPAGQTIKPENYEAVGLAVAGSLIGFPLGVLNQTA